MCMSLTRGSETFKAGLLVPGERSSCADDELVRERINWIEYLRVKVVPHLMLAASVRHRNVRLVAIEIPIGSWTSAHCCNSRSLPQRYIQLASCGYSALEVECTF
ncbi:hypothetical protein L914_07632 [Phytophthora nicotianae]|uniref:Uncharacterized protein n=2 Tax=Phytophthora nicotianae TaxID=4792 RepID=V9FC69_PHYNI|nr:hypothetical protein F443_07904 [Phytophthora nicotianae P1569]ETM47706.1 hypothetical protein L914_07632 [Phytophthora nicotianae]